MKKVIIFLFVISGITAALPASSQKAEGVAHGTIVIEGNPQKVQLFPGVYDFFGCTQKNATDSNSVTVCRHAITVDEDLAYGILGKGRSEQMELSGPVLDDVDISNILSYAEHYLINLKSRVEQELSIAIATSSVRPAKESRKERSMRQRDNKWKVIWLKRRLTGMDKENESRLEELEKRLKIRSKQGTIYIYQAKLQYRSI